MIALLRPASLIGLSIIFFSFTVLGQGKGYKGGDTVIIGGEKSGAGESLAPLPPDIDSSSAADIRSENTSVRGLPDSSIHRLKKDPAYAYANDPAYYKRKPKTNNNQPLLGRVLGSNGFRYFIYILMGSILLYAIIRIMMENNLRLFYRTPRKKTADVKDAEAESDNEDPDVLLRQSLEARNYRQATRFLYLRTLKRLSEGGLIRYHQQSTNQEYLLQLNGTPQQVPFNYLTKAYERVWYGELNPDEGQFDKLYRYFENFDKSFHP